MTEREKIIEALNGSGLSGHLENFQKAVLGMALSKLPGREDPLPDKQRIQNEDYLLLNSIGPAAAESVIDMTIRHCRNQGQLTKFQFGPSAVANAKMVYNDNEIGECNSFSNTLRQFLLPRYAYLDFDTIVDPRHQIDLECGYPKFITPIMYRYMYDRDDMASRCVDIYSDEIWAMDPEVYESDDETEDTEFETAWKDLCESCNILQFLYRIDKLAGIGHYGALLLGVGDGEDLERPINEPALLMGTPRSVASQRRQLLYLRPFDEYLSFIHQYDTDPLSPRYGLPVMYNLVFLDMTIDAAGASIGTRLNRRVHWTRVVHVADNQASSLVFGIPRQQQVFNRLLDIRKTMGCSAEMFYKGAFPGISFEVDPRFIPDQPEFDEADFHRKLDEYSSGLRRYLALVGVSAKSLAPQVADPSAHIRVQKEAIASKLGVPMRVFMGSEEGRLASSQDKLTWNIRLGRKIRKFTEPYVLRNFIDRCIAIGILPAPKSGRYSVGWGDLNKPTDEDKSNLALKWTQAMSQYVSTGLIHLIRPLDYLTMILGLNVRDAKIVVETMDMSMLKKVDPSQGAGRNGVAENNVSKSKGNDAPGKPAEQKGGGKSD